MEVKVQPAGWGADAPWIRGFAGCRTGRYS